MSRWLAYDLTGETPNHPLGYVDEPDGGPYAIEIARAWWPTHPNVQVILPEHAHLLVRAGVLASAEPPPAAGP